VLPLDRVARQRPKLIILGAEPEQLGRLLEAARELALGKAGLVIAVKPIGPYAEELPAGVPDSATIVRTWYPRLDASGPLLGSAREYAATYERTFGHQPDARAAAASAAGLIVQLAVERAGSTDVARVRAALDARGFDTFFGRLSWDAAGQRLGAPPLATIERRSLVPFEPNRLVGFAP
jgi:branched-chain amino acid transport system substrate-binding protein